MIILSESSLGYISNNLNKNILSDLKNIDFRNLTFLGKYVIEVDRDLTVEPYLLVRSDLTSYTFDASVLATYQKNMSTGILPGISKLL